MKRAALFTMCLVGLAIGLLMLPGCNISNFKCMPPASPQLDSISPTSIPAGTMSVELTLRGSGFSRESYVVYWGENGTPATYLSSSTLKTTYSSPVGFSAGQVIVQVVSNIPDECSTTGYFYSLKSNPQYLNVTP